MKGGDERAANLNQHLTVTASQRIAGGKGPNVEHAGFCLDETSSKSDVRSHTIAANKKHHALQRNIALKNTKKKL